MTDRSPSDREVMQRALDTWGEEAQINMAHEELGELQSELARLWRGRSTGEDVIDEIADVQIMMGQLAVVFGEKAVEEAVTRKMDRLNERLDDTT